MAHSQNYADTEKKLLLKLADVERNFVLKRGETTFDIQVKEIDGRELSALINLAGELARGEDTSLPRNTRLGTGAVRKRA